ncbi:MAG: DNA-directed RNA polymerase subunit beta' [Ruminococcaceae bacterium]|nr:DNA-directed RNA polymerase subunit beta' [Oscillospiraceae bacterium]
MSYATFDAIKIGIASPEMIRDWSFGEVKKPETINYRTLKPERDGLFCEKIFGPTKDWECHCGKYKKIRYKGKVCDRCGVEVTRAKVRRERMGHIELATPVSHIWYFKGIPSRMGLLLDISPRILEKVLYFAAYIVTDPGETPLMKNQILSEKEYRDMREKYEDDFDAGMGAEAVKKLLATVGLDAEESRRKIELMVRADELKAKKSALKEKGLELSEYELEQLEELEREMDTFHGLVTLSDQLHAELKVVSGQKKARVVKRLEVVDAFRMSGNKPEWMIIDVLPVIPPELRPMVQLDGGRFATSDLNDLYRRVINRNNRLKRLMELNAPDIIVRNEKRMLQEAVDALIDNGRRGRAVTGANNRALKSLSDMLKGKQGRFRQNLLGKRVDYSGRSVIVVGPELKVYQCGVPKEMAVELFRPFIMKKLVEDGSANNIKSAKKMVDKGRTEVWDALDEIIKDHPVMLNRAPTLHRLGIQAFEPVLVEGRALKLHPLTCTAFNADFDGDQMAIHVPLSAEAQAEARLLMLSANNLLRPQDGGPVTVPTQDMVLGSYYLTIERFENGMCQLTNDEFWPADVDFALAGKSYDDLSEEEKAGVHLNVYRDEEEVMMAYNEHVIGIHQPVLVRVTKEWNGEKLSGIVRATPGRIIFNRNIPQELGFVKRFNEDGTPSEHFFDYEITETCGKKQLGKIVDRTIKQHGFTTAAEVLDNIKATGYKYSTRGSITISIADMTVPAKKYELIAETEERVVEIEEQFNMGFITDEERYKLVVREWEKTTADVTDALTENMDQYNPIFMMADSGARGSMKQIRQLTGMRGLMANTAGKTIEIPIKANFREGLSVLEYFTSSRGARKGLADTALRTADSGYLTRRMVDVCQEVIIREDDCGVEKGIVVSEISEGGQIIEKFAERIRGRFPVADICKPGTDEVLISKDHMMDENDAALLEKFDIHSAEIRTVLTCKAHSGICAKCYGMNLATSKPVGPGEAVGIIAAQSIGEPGTQLTMRTFHTGGVAGGDITQGLPRVEELFEARKPKKMATLAEIGGKVRFEEATKGSLLNIIVTADDGDTRTYAVPHTGLQVRDGDVIEKGKQLQDGALNPHDVLRIRGASAVHNYLIQEVLKVYRQQGVDINDKHIEVIVRQMMRKVRIEEAGDTNLLSGAMADILEVEDENAKIRARIANGETNPDGEELQEATYTQLLMGITKASLATDSFLSAASFQETTKVLTEAAIKGKVDHLTGLKENVIIGKLIPAGAGLNAYRQFAEQLVPEAESAEEAVESVEEAVCVEVAE